MSHPKLCSEHVGYSELKADKTLRAHRKLLPVPEEFKSGTLPIISVTIRSNFFDPSVWQSRRLIPKHLLLSFCNVCLKPKALDLIQLSMSYTSFSISVSEPLMYVGSWTLSCMWSPPVHTFVIKFGYFFFCLSVSC